MSEGWKPIWINYPKTYRVPVHLYIHDYPHFMNKYYLSKNDANMLMGAGKKIVREKMDGESKSFIDKEFNIQVFYEDLTIPHIIPYTDIPNRKVVYAIWDLDERKWFNIKEFKAITQIKRWFTPPILKETVQLLELEELIKFTMSPSTFNKNHGKEGIIIMNESYHLEGKIINPSYDRD